MKTYQIYRRHPGGTLEPIGRVIGDKASTAVKRARVTKRLDGRWKLTAIEIQNIYEEK